jgi:hypothetical protein
VQSHLEVQPGLALAKCGRLWPAAAGSGLAAAGSGQLRPAVVRRSLARLRPDLAMVQSDLAKCGRSCIVALVYPSMVHLSIVIPIFVYLQEKCQHNSWNFISAKKCA